MAGYSIVAVASVVVVTVSVFVALLLLSPPDARRAMPQSGGVERHERSGPGTDRRAGDGGLVPGALGGELSRRNGLELL